MELYFNEELIQLFPGEGDVRAAFEELREGDVGYLLLRRSPESALSVLRAPGVGYFVTAEHGDGLIGAVLSDDQAVEAAEALLEFRRGGAPKVLAGPVYEDDCPLCKEMASQEARARAAMN